MEYIERRKEEAAHLRTRKLVLAVAILMVVAHLATASMAMFVETDGLGWWHIEADIWLGYADSIVYVFLGVYMFLGLDIGVLWGHRRY